LISLWLKIIYTLFVCVLVPVYVRQYGFVNFLWFSDIALLLTVPALWLESSLLASTMIVAVILFETLWNVDYFLALITGKKLIGLSAYMFDQTIPLWIRALSLFHVVLPLLLLWMVYRLGYDSRAFLFQTILALILLPVSYLLSTSDENVNWVYGFGAQPQTWMPAPLFVLVLMIAFPLLVYLPTHLLMLKIFNPK